MEAPGIEYLEKCTSSRLRSGIAIDSVTQCIDELVTNSIDAGASCIAVRTNISILRFQVVDNGCGLAEDQLSCIGERYATSKCNGLSDLERLEKFGFRGEALASLKDLSSILEIESRVKTSSKTFCKIFSNSNPTEVFQGKKDRPSQGTTVTVHSLFHNLPVRQKRIIESLEVESIRHRLAAIALIHPKISFSLRDDSSSSIILQTRRTGSIGRSFAALFGDTKACCLKEIKYSNREFNIEGFIGTEGHHNKNLQFMYINSRLLLKTKLHKLINALLGKSLIARKRLWQASEKIQGSYSQINANSPGKATDQYGIFVLDISCPLADYEITLDPRKTLVEFKEWEKIIGCCTQLVNEFLIRENLTMVIENTTTETGLKKPDDDQFSPSAKYDLHKDFAYCSGVERYGQAISTSSCTNTLQSLIVKRPSTSETQSGPKDVLHSDSQDEPDETSVQNVSLAYENDVNIPNVGEQDTNCYINPEPFIAFNMSEVCPSSDSTPGESFASSKERQLCPGSTNQPSLSGRSDAGAASETTESAFETEEDEYSGHDFTDNTCNQPATNVQRPQKSTLSVKVNGQEIVEEIEFLEENCHQKCVPVQTVNHLLGSPNVQFGSKVGYDRKQRELSSGSDNNVVSVMSSGKMSDDVDDKESSKMEVVSSDIRPDCSKCMAKHWNKDCTCYASISNHRAPIEIEDTKLKRQCCEYVSSQNELPRKTFQQLSGRDLLEDLEKLDADSQESVAENESFTNETNSFQEVQNSSTNHNLKNYTNSLQMFKMSACRIDSVQPLLTLKLKQQKKSCYTHADKQTSKPECLPQVAVAIHHPSSKTHIQETSSDDKVVHDGHSKANFPDADSNVNKPISSRKKSFRRKQDLPKGSAMNLKQIKSLSKLQKYKRKSIISQPVIQKFSCPSRDQSPTLFKVSRILPVANQVSKDNEQSRFFTSSQLLPKLSLRVDRMVHMTSSQFIQTAQKTNKTSSLDHHRPHENVKSDQEKVFMSSSQFMDTVQKRVSRERPSCKNVAQREPRLDVLHRNLKAVHSNIDNSIINKDEQDQMDCEGQMVAISYSNKKLEVETRDIRTKQLDNPRDMLQAESERSPEEKCGDSKYDDVDDVVNVDLQQGSILLDNDFFANGEDVHYISKNSEVITSSTDSIYVTADDMQLSSFNSSENEMWSDATDYTVDVDTYKIAGGSEKQVFIEHLSKNIDSKNKHEDDSHQTGSDIVESTFHIAEDKVSFGPNTKTEITISDLETTFESAPDAIPTIPGLPEGNLNSFEASYTSTGELVTGKESYDTNLSLTSSSKFSPSSSNSTIFYQNLPYTVPKENDSSRWLCHFDQRLGKKVYVNKISGNSQFVEPNQIEKDGGSECEDDNSCSVSKDQKKRPHPFLSHNAMPFLPRTKKQRQSFNPHGISGEDANESLAERSTTTSLENMVDDHLNELEVDIGCKWKNPSDFIETAGSDLESLWGSWDSGTTSLKEKDVITVCVRDAKRTAVRVHGAVHQYNFTKAMLSNVKILGQLDNKFIACMLPSQGNASGVEPNLLVLIDQHAAHERVRLERLTADAIEHNNDELDDGLSEVRIKSSIINPPITMALSPEEMRLIRGFHAKFQRIGLQLNCTVENSVEVTSVPACLVEHDASEIKHGRKPVTDTVVESLIKEQLTLWMQTSGACATMPQTIIRVLNSQACHGAIKFGDALDLTECQSLVDELAKCDLPFQCAHGRPSLLPILDFNLMRPVPDSEVPSQPQLWRLQRSRTSLNKPDEHAEQIESFQ